MLGLKQLTTMWGFLRVSAAMLGDSERPELLEVFTGVDQESPAGMVANRTLPFTLRHGIINQKWQVR